MFDKKRKKKEQKIEYQKRIEISEMELTAKKKDFVMQPILFDYTSSF